jgi:hypothetical protein
VVDVDAEHHRGTVVIQEPAVEARVLGDGLPLGHELQVRLAQADPEAGRVTFEVV